MLSGNNKNKVRGGKQKKRARRKSGTAQKHRPPIGVLRKLLFGYYYPHMEENGAKTHLVQSWFHHIQVIVFISNQDSRYSRKKCALDSSSHLQSSAPRHYKSYYFSPPPSPNMRGICASAGVYMCVLVSAIDSVSMATVESTENHWPLEFVTLILFVSAARFNASACAQVPEYSACENSFSCSNVFGDV